MNHGKFWKTSFERTKVFFVIYTFKKHSALAIRNYMETVVILISNFRGIS